jgi:two-component system, OmpR family, KDP operon response regulator KdpE
VSVMPISTSVVEIRSPKGCHPAKLDRQPNGVAQQIASNVRPGKARSMEKQGPRVLLVDDEQSILLSLGAVLPAAGYTVYQARNGKEALHTVHSVRPDLILLDLSLPDMDGKEVIRHLREWAITPIIVICARHEESEKVTSLDTGAHDYLTKPFTMPELLARMRATLRSVSATRDDVFAVDDLMVDLGRREVFVGETPVKLTATEYDLMKVLIHHAGNVRTHHQLIRELWGGTHYQDAVHLLRVTLSHLRRKLRSDLIKPRYIVTEPGVGYRLRTEGTAYPGTARPHSDNFAAGG